MSGLFCSTSGLGVAVRLAANSAGVLIAQNNKEKAAVILPVAKEIISKITGGSEAVTINSLVKQGIVKLVAMFSDNKLFQAEAAIVLNALGINISDATIPTLSLGSLKELIDSFVTGIETGLSI